MQRDYTRVRVQGMKNNGVVLMRLDFRANPQEPLVMQILLPI